MDLPDACSTIRTTAHALFAHHGIVKPDGRPLHTSLPRAQLHHYDQPLRTSTAAAAAWLPHWTLALSERELPWAYQHGMRTNIVPNNWNLPEMGSFDHRPWAIQVVLAHVGIDKAS
jgi:hypothetical protein